MPPRLYAIPLLSLLWVLSACNDESGLKVYNTQPAVSIVTPVGGSQFEEGTLVEFSGVARDNEQPNESLTVVWISDKDGELGVSPPDSEGMLFLATADLSVNVHTVTLSAVDDAGEQATTAVSIQVTKVAVDPNEGKPTVILTGPVDGSAFNLDEFVTFVGTATDPEQSSDTLEASLVSATDGTLWIGSPASNGVVSVDIDNLSVGEHLVTLSVVDQEGHSDTDNVNVTIIGDQPPTAEILAPADYSGFLITDTITLSGLLTDDLTALDALSATWESSLSGTLASGYADSSGATSFASPLAEGVHVITLRTLDSRGQSASDTITLTVRDPSAVDDDLDGYTEYDGDCDDTDVRVHPGASEICNERDDDCDGEINEDWLDSFEPNESAATAYDFGEVDVGWLWDAESITISGLSLNTASDQDWFTWNADDEYYDDVDISIRITGLLSPGNYVAELYMLEGSSWLLKDSDSGYGTLILDYPGTIIDLYDDTEDVWALGIRATSWVSTSCSATYQVDIDS